MDKIYEITMGIATQTHTRRLPVIRREKIIIESRSQCEEVADWMGLMFLEICQNIAPYEYVEFQNKVNRCELRTHGSKQIILMHRIESIKKYSVDIRFDLEYKFEPANISYEYRKVCDCFSFHPRRYLDYYSTGWPSGIYAPVYHIQNEKVKPVNTFANRAQPKDCGYIEPIEIEEHVRVKFRSIKCVYSWPSLVDIEFDKSNKLKKGY